MLVLGLWQLPNLGVGEAGMLLALLLLLAACLATASLGILATLVSARSVKPDESDSAHMHLSRSSSKQFGNPLPLRPFSRNPRSPGIGEGSCRSVCSS